MKQSTSFTQVATNLLNVLQGYTKGIRFLLVIFLTLCSSTMWGAKDDIVYKYGGTKLGTSESYASYSNSSISSSISGSTISTASWACTCGSNQSDGLWLGSNSKQKAKMILSTGNLSETSAIASAINVSTSDTYYSALICRTNFSNVYKVNLTYTTPGGTAPSEAWILYSIDNGSTWSVGKKVTSLSSSGTEFALGSTIPNARYAFVIHCANYCQFKVPILTFYEGETTPSCTAPKSVTISGSWDRFGGETISLIATPNGGTGDYSYQWQKYYDNIWNNITDNTTATTANLVYENCDGSHSGTYRCVVSTGTDCSKESDGLQVKVYTLECYTNGTNIYHFTRNGNTQSGTLTLNLNANTAYKFKVHVDNDYYGNGGTINKDETNWVLGAESGTPDLTVNSGLGGTFTFTIDYSTNGNNNTLGVPEISVTYPRKTIYLNPGVWNAGGAKYAIYYFIDGHDAWSDLFVGDACGTYTTIPQWNGVTMIAVRLKSDATGGTWDKKWNQTGNIPVNNNDYIAITGWGDNGDSPYTYSTFTPATYSITFNGNGNTGGSMKEVTGITCGGSATLTQNTFTRTGYTFAGWATSDNGEKVYDDKATISNITSNITLYAKWTPNANTAYTVKHYKQQLDGNYLATPDDTDNLTGTTAASVTPAVKSYEGFTAPSTKTVTIAADGSTVVTYQYTRNSYSLTWNLDGGAISIQGTAAGKVKYGAALTAPTVTKTGYTFAGWSPAVAATMPAANTTYTALWTQLHTITWMVGGSELTTGSQTTSVENGKKITAIPENPNDNTLEDCGATKFVGWSETNIGSTPDDANLPTIYTSLSEIQTAYPSITADITFYAVFASVSGSGAPTAYTAGDVGNFVLAAKNGSKWYALPANPTVNSGKIQGVEITVTTTSGVEHVTTANASGYTWTIANATNGQTISDGSKYIYHSNGGASGTNLTYGNSTSYTWKIEKESAGLTFKAMNGTTTNDRGMLMNETKFGGYALTNEGQEGYYRISVLPISDGVSYSNYVTQCCALAPATNLTVSGTTANSATLTWTVPSPTKGITKLQVRNAETNAVVVDDIAVNTTTATIIELEECTSYQYYVVSVGDCEVFSNTVTATPFSGAKTVNYNYNGGSGSTASFTTSCENPKIFLPNATRPGYTFNGWFDAENGGNHVGAAGVEYNPATSPITLYAHWTENIYQLNHSGSNYTITENKTSIKSSETPFTLHYTCTGDYGLPATISITGGGKSWTVGTDYTWEVAADKQSATLVIKETVISADVTITINVATRYTVTFIHNDKGIFDGSETLEVLSTENTITLPNITNVSCGFYDTFEGWIVANEDYTESTSKPAGTIYKGGANYTVNSDCTLHALYSKCEGAATQVYRKVTTIDEVTNGIYILVSNNPTPYVYSGHGDGNNYANITSGLQDDEGDYSTVLPSGAVQLTVTRGTGDNASRFTIQNGTKYFKAGSDIALQDAVSWWQLTTGEQVNSKNCPAGALQPVNATTYVMQEYQSNRFKTYQNTQSYHVFLYKLIDKCTRYYSTNPSCEKPVGVHIVYNANAVNASMSCSTQDRTYKVENEVNKYPQLASQLQFCTNATREGYTLVGWNTQANGQGTTYNINQNYYNLPVSGELDGAQWITLNLYAMWKPCIKFNLGNAIGGTGVPDAVVENGECVLPEPTPEQLGRIPCGYEFYAWSETSVQPTQTKPALFMAGDTYSGDASTLHAVYRLCEVGSNPDLFSLSYTIGGTKYYVGPVTKNQEGYTVKFIAITDANNATVFGMKSIEGKTYKSLYWMNEETKEYMYWKNNGASFIFTSEEDKSYGWIISGTTELTFLSTPYINNGSRYLSADASEIGCPSELKAVIQFTKEMASTMICTYATEPECSTTATLQFVTNGGTLNYPTTYDANSYQNLTPGTTVYLPTATFAGEWVFEGWKRGSQLESQTLKPNDPSFYSVTLNDTQFEVDGVGTIYFYAVYSKTKDDKQFDPVNGGTYKLFAIGEDGTKTYMPIWNGGRGTMSGVTTCAEAGDYTITPGTDTHAGQYQITCGEHTLGVVGDIGQTDLNEVEGTWWNINPSISGKGTWRITVVGSSNRALSALSKSFGNYSLTQINNVGQPTYRDMEIGECIYTEYTSTPENIPYITITGAPVKITSTNGESIYAPTTLHIEAHNFTGERIIHLSATNGFGVDPAQVRTNGQGAYSGNVKVYYEPTTDGDGQTITTSVLTAIQKDGTNAEKINQTFAAIQGRNMPANFIIAAKWDGHWYALPANCTSSLSSTEGLLIEVDDVDNPTVATAAPASAKYGLREVISSRQKDHGQGIVFTERFAEGDKQFALYNGSNANIQVNAQYANYDQTNPDKYEWIPTTSDFKDYTLTNASTGRNLGLTSGTFGAYTAASNQVRLLPATFYDPATAQVLKWKANSVIVMYTGAEATATTQVDNNTQSAEQTLANQEITHGIYELTTDQALTSNAGGTLSLYFGANTRVELEIPLIISGEVTASANAHDVVILENSILTAAATKYSYKDVYIYGGAKLAIPENTELGVNNIILRAGGVATNGAGLEATYQYIYPQVELKGTLTSSVQNIRYEYVTDYDHWYHLVLPFDGSLASIHYPYEYYGDQVKLDNTGSWQIKRYAGEIRATGNYNAWKDIENDEPKAITVTAGKGYIFWGAPKKVSVNGGASTRQKWGIQRITMSVSAPAAKTAENGDKTIAGLGSYENVPNNSRKDNDQGWNLIGNPYMVNLTTMSEDGLRAGKLVKEMVDDKWTGKWINNGENLRYLTIPSEHFETYEAKTVSEAINSNALVPGRAFFVQLEGEANGITFAAANRASLMPALLAENNDKPVDIETGIVLSNETLQDEVNFWIKDGKTNDYEYNADYPKTPNNNRFNIYGVHSNGDLSWVATGPEYAAESMPIGYQVPAAGTYMLSLSEIYNSDGLDALYVTDHALSPEVTVDIMSEPYEFSVNQAETNNERFTVSVRVKAKTENGATGLGNVGADGEQIHKFIYQDKIYILHHGVIYDATGKRVITINK